MIPLSLVVLFSQIWLLAKLNLLINIEAFRLGCDWEEIKDSSRATILIIVL